MDDKLSTEDLTGRSTATTEAAPAAESEVDVDDGAPVRSPLRDANRAGDEAAGSASDRPDPGAGARADAVAGEPLLKPSDAEGFEGRWRDIQVAFVDEPRAAVEQADNLVAELMRHLAATFADERRGLEEAWGAGEDVDTEELRVALTRYRSFFQRLLST